MEKKRTIGMLLALLFVLALFPVGVQAQSTDTMTHTVQPGDNLYRIALQYGVTMDALAQANNITNLDRINRGQVLVIPGLTVPDESAEVVNPLIAGTPVTHIVGYRETLSDIARQYGTTVAQIIAANNIANANHILNGQELTIWTAETVDSTVGEVPETIAETFVAGPAPENNITYVIQPNEQLAQIAQRYGMSWTTLAQMNGITNPDHIEVGQTIVIPALNVDGGIVDMGLISPPPGPAPNSTSGREIIVDLSDSRIYAYEDGTLVRNVVVSTGLPGTPTVQGDFTVRSKIRAQTMTGPGYYLPNVEWVMYFYAAYAIHGTYWHNSFGQPMSHGCVNLPNGEAKWFFDFATVGTPVSVRA